MPLIKTVPIRAASIIISGVPPRCRKIDKKYFEVGDFPENITTDEIRAKCVEKLSNERKGWKSVINCHMTISKGKIQTFKTGGEEPYHIKSVQLMSSDDIREQLAI